MADHKPPAFPERIILFGSEGGFSRPVLTRLLAHDVAVAAVVMPGVATTENADDRFPIAEAVASYFPQPGEGGVK